MRYLHKTALCAAAFALAACDVSGLSSQAYPGRTQYQFLSADREMIHTYACVPSETEQRTKNRAAQAHRYVDEAIRSAKTRFAPQAGFGGGLGARAELNAEISRISQQAEAEYRCIMLNRKNA
ncbi:hypothetical protein [Cognatiyoonia sp. IB215182]|uniref:hypothetical protein n=1 Tax=Cognatiyoonia sp. IB215182 TaxID=3097353 RepID=UPI002A168048|nr:hypothetical protein [Cognatiyoonia sp. IB215182]MDX8350973.1 hypothetical protein [Cognatiyoonia sp. IB215182]